MSSHPAVTRAANEIAMVDYKTSEIEAIIERETHYSELVDVLRKIYCTLRADWTVMTEEEKDWADAYSNEPVAEELLRSLLNKLEVKP